MIQAIIRLLFFAALAPLFIATAVADELWSYYFIADSSRPYFRDCPGDCSISGTRADLAGNFSILLDWNAGTGKLFALDDQLVNVASLAGSYLTGPILIPTVPPSEPHGLFPAGQPPEFASGQLTSVGDHWQLTSDGLIPFEGGAFGEGMSYDITFSLTSATLSLTLGQPFSGMMRVTNAPATFVSKGLPGDFNFDGRTDSRDYVEWRATSGSSADYTLWRSNFGNSASTTGAGAALNAIPEPTAAALLLLAILSCICHRRR